MPYTKEINTLKKAGRFRQRYIYDKELIDFASNDYLGLSQKKSQLKKAIKYLDRFDSFSPKASMLVNGYHPIHKEFEEEIALLNGFESAIVVGSGFLANFGLIEALVRRGDELFIDEEYHASGMVATRLLDNRVNYFSHNNPKALRNLLLKSQAKRKIVAVEAVYSMSGELLNREIFDVVEEFGALMIVDEAHSSGVLGDKLLGIFDFYKITPQAWHIKMGTLGKAYGSYGAYILASNSIISFLENRAKPIIYSTAPSVIDTTLALENLKYIKKHSYKLNYKLIKRRKIVKDILGISISSQILPISISSNREALYIQQLLKERGYIVGAIRQPTVKSPILRVIPRLSVSKKSLKAMLNLIRVSL